MADQGGSKHSKVRKPPKIQCRPIIGHHAKITAAALSYSTDVIFSMSVDNTLRLWDFEECQLVSTHTLTLDPHTDGCITSLTTSQHNVACCSNTGTVMMIDALNIRDRGQKCKFSSGRVNKPAFSPDGRRMIIPCSDNRTYIYDIRSNIVIQPLYHHTNIVTGAVYRNDDRYCVTSSLDRSCAIWDLRWTNKMLNAIQLDFPALTVASCANDLIIVCGLTECVHIYDPGLSTPLWTSSGHGAWPNHVTVSEDQYVYTSADYDVIAELDTMTGSLEVLCGVELERVFAMKLFNKKLRIVGLPHEEDIRSYRNNEGNRANATREVIEALNKADAGEEKVFNKKASRASVGVYQPEETEIRNPKPSAQPEIPCIQELAPLPTIVKSTKGPADPPPRPLSVPSVTETDELDEELEDETAPVALKDFKRSKSRRDTLFKLRF